MLKGKLTAELSESQVKQVEKLVEKKSQKERGISYASNVEFVLSDKTTVVGDYCRSPRPSFTVKGIVEPEKPVTKAKTKPAGGSKTETPKKTAVKSTKSADSSKKETEKETPKK